MKLVRFSYAPPTVAVMKLATRGDPLAAVLLELREQACAICENDRVHTEGAIIPQTAYDVQAFRPAGFDSRPFPDASIMANDSSEKLFEVCASIR